MDHFGHENALSLSRRRTRRFALLAGGLAVIVALTAILERLGLPNRTIADLLIGATVAVYIVIGLAYGTMRVSEFYVAGQRVPPAYAGMAMAADWISGALFFGLAGLFYALGQQAFAFLIGWTGGYVLLAVLIAPHLRKSGAYTVPDFLAGRFGGRLVRLLAMAVLIAVSFAYLVTQVFATGFIAERFLGIDFQFAAIGSLVVMVACSLLGGMRSTTWTQVAQYIVIALACLTPLVLLATRHYGIPIPHLVTGYALHDAQAQSAGTALVVEQAIRDFVGGGPAATIALVACLTIGTASLPHFAARTLTTPSVRAARTALGWGLVFALVVLLAIPAAAALTRLEIATALTGAGITTLPDWVYTLGHNGLLTVCGVPAASPEAVASACAGASGTLELRDLAVDGNAVLLALPQIAGQPFVLSALVAVGALAATLSTANGLLLAIANTLSHDGYFKLVHPGATAARRLIIARLILLPVAAAAGYTALLGPLDMLSGVVWAFSLAAAGNFPALVLGIWWKRCTAAGAAAGIVAGLAVTLACMVATELGPDLLRASGDEVGPIYGIGSFGAGLFGVAAGFLATVAVSLITRAPSGDTAMMVQEIHQPRGEAPLRDRAT